MPVAFNEPLSFLQRLTEYMEYSHLLEKASESDDVLERMQVCIILLHRYSSWSADSARNESILFRT